MLGVAAKTLLALEAGIIQGDDISRSGLPVSDLLARQRLAKMFTSSSFFRTDPPSCSKMSCPHGSPTCTWACSKAAMTKPGALPSY